ncbi:MAG: thiamine-phosphate kinase, partial [Dehalococcoidales bacterium]|nr:thiamine-phosphate kinase [Dehalococcoidales bacterium]
MKIDEINEFDLIAKINELCRTTKEPSTTLAIGDDCAQWKNDHIHTIATTDTMVQDVHYILPCDRYKLGRRALAINISDIAAMGGTPQHALISLGLVGTTEVDEIIELYKGICDIAIEYSMDVIGGNITHSANEFISVTVTGSADRLLRRDAAKIGDLICVTGSTGAAAAGRESSYANKPCSQDLYDAFWDPVPQVKEGLEMNRLGIHAAIDISDGLIADLKHICDASHVGAEIWCGKLPIPDEAKRLFPNDYIDLAVYGGEDYELIFTGPEDIVGKLSFPYTVIGKITDTKG